ncbi:hypothetical protein GXW82_17430 [Streptacidiphilus sp. 4-A2]|nr:hypothetical protein [Streptacidiphilus sp. 4-A2]
MTGWRKARLAAVTITAASVVLAMGSTADAAPLAAVPGTTASSGAPVPVIVVLKDQLAAVPADAPIWARASSRPPRRSSR